MCKLKWKSKMIIRRVWDRKLWTITSTKPIHFHLKKTGHRQLITWTKPEVVNMILSKEKALEMRMCFQIKSNLTWIYNKLMNRSWISLWNHTGMGIRLKMWWIGQTHLHSNSNYQIRIKEWILLIKRVLFFIQTVLLIKTISIILLQMMLLLEKEKI